MSLPKIRGWPKYYLINTVMTYEGDDCLIWPYGKNPDGYGRIKLNNKQVIVSRWVCTQVYGPPPSIIHEAAHLCGKGHEGCVAKKHLKWKTPKENWADRYIHGTSKEGISINAGESHGFSKLTDDEVIKIRALGGTMFQREIAAEFNVSISTISEVLRRKRWKHI